MINEFVYISGKIEYDDDCKKTENESDDPSQAGRMFSPGSIHRPSSPHGRRCCRESTAADRLP